MKFFRKRSYMEDMRLLGKAIGPPRILRRINSTPASFAFGGRFYRAETDRDGIIINGTVRPLNG